jgi:hypothetical protein
METVKPELIVVETLGSHERVQARDRIALTAEKRHVTIGRSAEADVILDDAYAAALHASVEAAPDGTILVSDLGSENGVGIAGRRHKGAQQLPVPGGLLQIGRTRLRVRSTTETLPPEKPDRAGIVLDLGSPSWAAAAGALACAVYVAYAAWLEAPRDVAGTIVVAFIPALLAAGAWIALWALLSRVMQGEWRWLWHGAILFSVVAVYVLSESLLDIAWFVYALPRWESRGTLIAAVAFAVALYWHLTHASSVSRRRAAFIAILLPASVTCAALWIQVRIQDRDVNHIGVKETVYPPALRVRKGGDVRDFFERAALLKVSADSKRSKILADDVSDYGIWSD